MALSKKEQRKISKETKRSESVTFRSGSYPDKQAGQAVTHSAVASAEDDAAKCGDLAAHKPSAARSLSKTFESLATQQPSAARKTDIHLSINASTIRSAGSCPLYLRSPVPDPFVECGKEPSPEKNWSISKLDRARSKSKAELHTNQSKARTISTPPTTRGRPTELPSHIHDLTPLKFCLSPAASSGPRSPSLRERFQSLEALPPSPSSGPKSSQEERRFSPDRSSASDEFHSQEEFPLSNLVATSTMPMDLDRVPPEQDSPTSVDGAKDRQMINSRASGSLAHNQPGPRHKQFTDGKAHSTDLSSFAAFRASARPIPKHPVLPSFEIPLPVHAPASSATGPIGPDRTSMGISCEKVLPELPQLETPTLATVNKWLTAVPEPETGKLGFNNLRFRASEKSLVHMISKNGPPSRSIQNFSQPFNEPSGPINLARALPPPYKAPPSYLTGRYELNNYETWLKFRRMSNEPDWSRDARGRGQPARNGYQPAEFPPRKQCAKGDMTNASKPKQEASWDIAMNKYTRLFYDANLDGARHLPEAQKANKAAADLGGLLP